MSNKIIALAVSPGKAPYAVSMENDGAAAERIIGGEFDAYFLMPQKVLLLHRRDGKAVGLPRNRKNPYLPGYIHGTFLLCALGEKGDFSSLPPANIREFQASFALPEAPREYMMVGETMCITPNELLLATYGLWDNLSPGETVVLTRGGEEDTGR